MRRMKLLIFFVCLICTIPSFSQDDYDRSLNELEKVNDLLLDASASFLKFPNNHSNTIIVFNQLKELNTIYKLKIESEPRKLKEFINIMDLYKENPKGLIEEIDLLDKLKSKKGRELVTKQGSSFYMDEIVLGSNMKSVASTLLKPESVDLLKKFYLNFD